MAIKYEKSKQRFLLQTESTTYAFEVLHNKYLMHLYYGKKRAHVPDAPERKTVSFSPYDAEFDAKDSVDVLPLEYSFYGSGDFRACALRLRGADGSGVTEFFYKDYRIHNGRLPLDGLPCARADEHTQTLEIRLTDRVNACVLHLFYTVFEKEDVISRYLTLENVGTAPVTIEKCMSLCLDIPSHDYQMLSLHGKHNGECMLQKVPLHYGMQSIGSRRGTSSHQFNPFFALADRKSNGEKGEVYGFNFVYSGSFLNEVEVDQTEKTRVLIGLGSEQFSYTVHPNESFTSPEAVMTFSAKGTQQMSRNFHDFVRNRILPPVAVQQPHPVVLNTWEACYFDIDAAVLQSMAKEAVPYGIDMLVMDDGWFGSRRNSHAGLGDWYTYAPAFPMGLAAFVDSIRQNGLRFGIWIEPEMVNPDSELYRNHPEWCLHVEGRAPKESRHQLVLDMCNPAVIQYLKDCFSTAFRGVAIDYFKWDMNRHLSDVASSVLDAAQQGEVRFRYMKGVYSLLEWFRLQFPNAIIETCSGGGGRYDLGMMPYGIQIWTSDNTDPHARQFIQSGALLGYPAATMSCHVSNPHEDMVSLDYRYKVALAGMLGYELNILNMSQAVKDTIREQIRFYRTVEHLMRCGDYTELVSPFASDYSAYYYISKERDELLLSLVEGSACKHGCTKKLHIRDALEEKTYIDTLTQRRYTGKELKDGLVLTLTGSKDSAQLLHLKVEI